MGPRCTTNSPLQGSHQHSSLSEAREGHKLRRDCAHLVPALRITDDLLTWVTGHTDHLDMVQETSAQPRHHPPTFLYRQKITAPGRRRAESASAAQHRADVRPIKRTCANNNRHNERSYAASVLVVPAAHSMHEVHGGREGMHS